MNYNQFDKKALRKQLLIKETEMSNIEMEKSTSKLVEGMDAE
jgi:hypothetical protein